MKRDWVWWSQVIIVSWLLFSPWSTSPFLTRLPASHLWVGKNFVTFPSEVAEFWRGNLRVADAMKTTCVIRQPVQCCSLLTPRPLPPVCSSPLDITVRVSSLLSVSFTRINFQEGGQRVYLVHGCVSRTQTASQGQLSINIALMMHGHSGCVPIFSTTQWFLTRYKDPIPRI